MFIRLLVLFWLSSISSMSWSFPCFYTLMKDSCWTDYNVSVDVIDATSMKTLFTIAIPAGKTWERTKFNCTPAQNLRYVASFSPVFWSSDVGKTYPGIRNWTLPGSVTPTDVAWTIPVCYPGDFANVPLPPTAKGNCACDATNIPAPQM